MTVIELFDSNAVENIVTMLTYAPEKIIFISYNNEAEKAIEDYRKIAKSRNIEVKLSVKKTNRNSLTDILNTLIGITGNEECVIDLTGGDELYLVAAGMVNRITDGKAGLVKFNIPSGKMVVCTGECVIPCTDNLSLSVAENILAYGGRVIFEDEKAGGCRKWNFDKILTEDILNLWSICIKDTNLWNKQVSALSALYAASGKGTKNEFYASSELLAKADKAKISAFLADLYSKELVSKPCYDNGLYFNFKNGNVKQIVTKAGLLLELYISLLAKNAADKKGEPVYSDVLTGVTIDWDGQLMRGCCDVGNEVDVVLMKGLVPVFISCKNGYVDTDELYKLSTVAAKFGGKYVKKVLVAPEVDLGTTDGKYLSLRAESLGITLICDLFGTDADKLSSVISTLWK